MARVILGDRTLSETPILSCRLSSTSPLSWKGGAADAVVEAANIGSRSCPAAVSMRNGSKMAGKML